MTQSVNGFLKRFGSTLLVAWGLAASAAHADPASQCPASKDGSALAQFEMGTTFLLTDNGLIVLKRPAAKKWYSPVKSSEPDFPQFPNVGG
jgi:hypothetical protein